MRRAGRYIFNGLTALSVASTTMFAGTCLISRVARFEATLANGHVVAVRDGWVSVGRAHRGGGFGLRQ